MTEAYLSYKLIIEPKGSSELIILHLLNILLIYSSKKSRWLQILDK